METREFELDVEEQHRRIDQGKDAVSDLKLELKAWNLARAECAVKVKSQVWSSLETPGKFLKGINSSRVVPNFPLPNLTQEEKSRLEHTIKVKGIKWILQ
mgnify:CR=1 FL=1